MAYTIHAASCLLCGVCALECPQSAIAMGDDAYVIDAGQCTECHQHPEGPRCEAFCPVGCCVRA